MRMEYNKGNEQDETQMNHVNIGTSLLTFHCTI